MFKLYSLLYDVRDRGWNGSVRLMNSGSVFHDYMVGVELNPRLGQHWDLKMFQVGRLGMNSWVVM